MLATALRRHRRDGPFDHLEERLLDSLAGDIAGNGRIFRLAADLVDFVNVDDATLGAFNIVLSRLQQLENDVLNVFAHVARLGERGRVRHGEGDIENAGEGLGE